MGADLRKRIEQVEAGFGPPTIMGLWAHRDGTPVYHRLSALDMDLDRWLRTGELPKNAEFMGVIAVDEAERHYRPEPERTQPYEFVATDEQLDDHWTPFPDLHPDALRQFQRMLEVGGFYTFVQGQLRGMNGPLPPSEQRRELYPHG